MKKTMISAVCSLSAMLTAQNIVQNGGFDFPLKMNGSNAFFNWYDEGAAIYASQPAQVWRPTMFAGWWIHAAADSKVNMEDGGGFIRLSGSGFALCSSPVPLPAPDMVLSLDVRTKDAAGKIILQGISQGVNYTRNSTGDFAIDLPKNTEGKTVRLSVPGNGMKGPDVAVRVELTEGTVEIDDVQLEAGKTATDFDVKSSDFFEITLNDFTSAELPRFYSSQAKDIIVRIRNNSRNTVLGKLTLFLDNWQHPGETVFREIELNNWQPDNSIEMPLMHKNLPPDAYVLIAEFTQDGQHVVSKEIYNSKNTGAGVIGLSQLSSRNGLRFAVFPDAKPAELFGVANGMVGVPCQNFFGGAHVDDFRWGKELHFSGYLGQHDEGSIFNYAVGGAQAYVHDSFDCAEPGRPDLTNPSARGVMDIHNPESKKIYLKRAEALGKYYAKGPGIAGTKMNNEQPYPNAGATCPTKAADAAFRAWVQKRYQSLYAVNKAWHKKYKSWDEVEQIVSARMAEEQTTIRKEGAANLDWYANMGNFSKAVVELMHNDPGRAMDWCRWRSESGLEAYMAYRAELKKHAPDLLVGVNQPCVNFWPQIFFPFWREDAAMLDVSYTSHMTDIDLGNSEEAIDNLEMADSVTKDRPVWGIEIYVQPTYKPEFAAFQNWGVLAHGMTQNLTFAWRPYSDHGTSMFTEPKAWTKPGAVPMWLLIDMDGTPLPSFEPYTRSVLEIEKYHQKYDGNSIKRLPTRTAVYLPNDSVEFDVFFTANCPWNSTLENGRQTTHAQLRLAGATLDYFDDPGLLALNNRDYDTIIVTSAPVIADETLDKLADFAKNGGKVIFQGPCAVYDPCLNRHAEFANGKFVEGWSTPPAWSDWKEFLKEVGKTPESGAAELAGIPAVPGAEVLKSESGDNIGWSIKLGKGSFIQLTRWPCRYGFDAVHQRPELRAVIADLVRIAQPRRAAYWTSEDTPEKKGYSRPGGDGAPYVEVVMREKSDDEKFLFVLNQGGRGSGTVVLEEGGWTVEDVINERMVPMIGNKLMLELPCLGYRVFRLTR